jgi:hypothetical protein
MSRYCYIYVTTHGRLFIHTLRGERVEREGKWEEGGWRKRVNKHEEEGSNAFYLRINVQSLKKNILLGT